MTQGEFSGLTALVTGGSIGIGAETAVGLARGGARVLVHYNSSRTEAEEVLGRVRAAGGDGELLQADLGTRAGVEAFCESIRGREIDILVNNAGSLVERRRIVEFTWELYDRVMMLNTTSVFFVTQAVAAKMAARGRGVVVNVGSIAGRTGGGLGASVYAMAKGALETLTKAQAKEFAPQGMRVNGVSPGTVDTKFHRQFSTAQMLEGVRAMTPVGRLGTSEEIADVIVYLCSERAAFIHGQMIEVNGGFYML